MDRSTARSAGSVYDPALARVVSTAYGNVLLLLAFGCGQSSPGGSGSGSTAFAGSGGGGAAASNSGGVAGQPTNAGGGSAETTRCVSATAALSPVIPTVATVTFTTTLTNIEHGEVEFGAANGGAMMVAPIDVANPERSVVLVGMKPNASYAYRVRLTASAGSCVSPDQFVATGSLPLPPELKVAIVDPLRHDGGFMLIVGSTGGAPTAYILDADGEAVWAAPAGSVPKFSSRVHLSWDAKRFIVMAANPLNADQGGITSMAMDGSDVRSLPATEKAHHDFAAVPGGIAAIFWNGGSGNAPCSLVELPDTGGSRTIVADMSSLYRPNVADRTQYHTNSVHYYASDHSFTLGDQAASLYVKVSADGELVWQFGGTNPNDPSKSFSGVTPWAISHGHHLTADGVLAIFNNTADFSLSGSSKVLVYRLDGAALTGTLEHEFDVRGSLQFGDVQRLPGGNFLVTSSVSGYIAELTPDGTEVMSIDGESFGYTEFRKSLYGPPEY